LQVRVNGGYTANLQISFYLSEYSAVRSIISLLVILLTTVLSDCTAATVQFQQEISVGDANTAHFSNLPGPASQQQAADDFSLSAPATLTGLEWGGHYGEANPTIPPIVDFRIRIFSGDSVPQVLVHDVSVSAVAALEPIYSRDGYYFEASLPAPLSIDGGRHWISILESDPDTALDFAWFHTGPPYNDIYAVRATEGADWIQAMFSDFGFILYGVPEPPSIILSCLGLGAVAALRGSKD
jgi:hypothetical protein